MRLKEATPGRKEGFRGRVLLQIFYANDVVEASLPLLVPGFPDGLFAGGRRDLEQAVGEQFCYGVFRSADV